MGITFLGGYQVSVDNPAWISTNPTDFLYPPTMTQCTVCKGSGHQKIHIIHAFSDKQDKELISGCMWCGGDGDMNDKQLEWKEEYDSVWCKCTQPSEEPAQFWNDGEHPTCEKHCWTCPKCNKITQIG
jgi:hypothetical protein